jgi:hypothetical protein
MESKRQRERGGGGEMKTVMTGKDGEAHSIERCRSTAPLLHGRE